MKLMETLHIKAASVDAEMRTLSGGNQQKVQIVPLARGRRADPDSPRPHTGRRRWRAQRDQPHFVRGER